MLPTWPEPTRLPDGFCDCVSVFVYLIGVALDIALHGGGVAYL